MVDESSSCLEMDTESMDAIMDSFPSISEDRPVVTPAGRERAAFLVTRRDDLRDMVVLSRSSTYLAEIRDLGCHRHCFVQSVTM